MIKLTYSKSILSSIATILLLLLSISILSHSQFQLSSSDASFASFLFSPSSSTVMVLAQPSNESNTTMGNTPIGNSNNESAGAINTTGMQSNETGNRTIARWISLGPIQQVTQSNGTANNSIAATTTTTNATGKGVQITERATDPAILQQTSKVPITKEEATKAEQEASIMIKAYYEKVEQEKREQAAALAAAQANQTTQATDTIEGSEGGATAASDETETETEAEEEQEDQDDEEGNEEGDENENGDDEEG